MDRPPVAWIFSDAPYAGGAERYLEFLLQAAGPARLGLVAVENPGLVPWIDAVAARGFVVDRIPAGSLLSRWSVFASWCRRRRPQLLNELRELLLGLAGQLLRLFQMAPGLFRVGVQQLAGRDVDPGVRVGVRPQETAAPLHVPAQAFDADRREHAQPSAEIGPLLVPSEC